LILASSSKNLHCTCSKQQYQCNNDEPFHDQASFAFFLLKTKINSAINLYKIERLKAEMVTKEKI